MGQGFIFHVIIPAHYTLREKCRIQRFSGPYFPALRLNTERYSEYGHFLRSDTF